MDSSMPPPNKLCLSLLAAKDYRQKVRRPRVHIVKSVAMALLLFSLNSCFLRDVLVAKYEDTRFFSISEREDGHDLLLDISGVILHSSWGVRKVRTIVNNDEALVYVYMTPGGKGITGRFFHSFAIPKEVEKVSYGKNGHIIWQRGVGPVMQVESQQ